MRQRRKGAMLSDLLDFLLQVSIWGTDNEIFSKRTQRVFQGIILLFLIAFAAVGVLLLYAGCDTGSGKLIFCGVFVFACIAIICRSAYKRKKKRG
jgi:hypothetical protein